MTNFRKILISVVLVILVITSSFLIPVSAVSSSTSSIGTFFTQVAAKCLTSGYDDSSYWLPYTDDNTFSYVYRNGVIPSGTTLDIDYEFQVSPEFTEEFLYYDMHFTFRNVDNAKFYNYSKWYFVFEDGSTSSPALFSKVSSTNTVSLIFNGLATNYPIRLKSIVFDMRYTTTVEDSDMGLNFTSVSLKMYDENRKNTEDIMANQTENTDRIINNQTEIAEEITNGWSSDKTADGSAFDEEQQLVEDIENTETKILIGYGADGEPIYSEGTFTDMANSSFNSVLSFMQTFLMSPLGLRSASYIVTRLMAQDDLFVLFSFSIGIGFIPFILGLSIYAINSGWKSEANAKRREAYSKSRNRRRK